MEVTVEVKVGDVVKVTYPHPYWKGFGICTNICTKKDTIVVRYNDGKTGGFRQPNFRLATKKEILEWKLTSKE